jgi:hypothetical protein
MNVDKNQADAHLGERDRRDNAWRAVLGKPLDGRASDRKLAVEADAVRALFGLQASGREALESCLQTACPGGSQLGQANDVWIIFRDQTHDRAVLVIVVSDVDDQESEPGRAGRLRLRRRPGGCDHEQVHDGEHKRHESNPKEPQRDPG